VMQVHGAHGEGGVLLQQHHQGVMLQNDGTILQHPHGIVVVQSDGTILQHPHGIVVVQSDGTMGTILQADGSNMGERDPKRQKLDDKDGAPAPEG